MKPVLVILSAVRKWVRGLMKRAVLFALNLSGHDMDSLSVTGALQRARARGDRVATVIDIGCSDGRWTEECLPFYPSADYLLLDAQPAYRPLLDRLAAKHTNIRYLLAAVGDKPGEATLNFDPHSLAGGVVAGHQPGQKTIPVPMTTVDEQVRLRRLTPPYLIKMDTHGYEIAILEGARNTLPETGILILELYNFNFSDRNKRFHEMCAYLEGAGFRPADLWAPVYRPDDGALWQFDMLFLPRQHPVFQQNQYK